MKLVIAFIVVPVIEIFLITQVASQIQWPLTLVLVIGVSMIGAFLVKREGLGVIDRVRNGFGAGKLPTDELADGAMIFFASALMLTPGFLTDFLGLALLIPPIRALMRPGVISFFKKRVEVKTSSMGVGFGGGVGPGAGQSGFPGAGFPGGFGRTRRPGFGRDVFDVDGQRSAADADITDITPNPGELGEQTD